jgi:hypothetical protein
VLAVHTLLGLTETEYGQAALGVLVAVIGYVLHRKSTHIEVKVNGQMTMLVARIAQLESRLSLHAVPIPAALPVVEVLAAASAAQELGKISNGV